MIDRQTSYLFAFALLLVFILVAQPHEQLALMVGIGFSLTVVVVVFILGFLTLDAIIPATLVGAVAYGFGGLGSLAVLAVFFVSGSLLTLLNDRRSINGRVYQSRLSCPLHPRKLSCAWLQTLGCN